MKNSIAFLAKALTCCSFVFLGYLLFYQTIEHSKKIGSEMFISILFLGMALGIFIHAFFQSVHRSYLIDLDKIKIENQFKAILENSKSLDFSKRIADLVFFSYLEYSLVFNIKKNEFFLFLNDECVLNSITISDTKTIYQLREIIWANFSSQINDTVTFNNVIYSKNLVNQEQPTNPMTFDFNKAKEMFKKLHEDILGSKPKNDVKELDIDEILDKINKFGMESLTQEELNFLKNQSD